MVAIFFKMADFPDKNIIKFVRKGNILYNKVIFTQECTRGVLEQIKLSLHWLILANLHKSKMADDSQDRHNIYEPSVL